MEQADVPYVNSINLTPPDKKEIDWDITIDSFIERAVDSDLDNILLPIYRYTILESIMKYNIGTIIHEC